MYNIIELKWNNKESYLLPLLHMPRLDLAAKLFFSNESCVIIFISFILEHMQTHVFTL